jgi:hypothetical protein
MKEKNEKKKEGDNTVRFLILNFTMHIVRYMFPDENILHYHCNKQNTIVDYFDFDL